MTRIRESESGSREREVGKITEREREAGVGGRGRQDGREGSEKETW